MTATTGGRRVHTVREDERPATDSTVMPRNVVKIAAWVPITVEMLIDRDPFRYGGMSYRLNPNPFPRIHLFHRRRRSR